MVTPMGLTSNAAAQADIEYAFDRGINYFSWGCPRMPAFGAALRQLARGQRSDLAIAVEVYGRWPESLQPSLDAARRALGIDYVDVLSIGWLDAPPHEALLAAAQRLVDDESVRDVIVTCDQADPIRRYVDDMRVGAFMVRYSAAYRRAESDVFPRLGPSRPLRPGVVAQAATCWGNLLDPSFVPHGEPAPTESDCYRFAFGHPDVQMTLASARTRSTIDSAISALDRGPMDRDELAWMRRVGLAVRRTAWPAKQSTPRTRSGVQVIDLDEWKAKTGERGRKG
jgi:hypothetical protein